MISVHGRSRRDRRRAWGPEVLEGRQLMASGLNAQFAPGWGDAVDVRFERFTTAVQESAGLAPITLTRGGDLSLGATVRVRTAAVDAVEGFDYYGFDQAVAFAPGSATATFSLTILNDDVAEPESKALYLQAYQPSDVISSATIASMMVLIQDDEAASKTPLTFHAFGDAGLWTYNDVEGYRKINDASPEAIYSAPNRGAYLDFGQSGFWYWDALTGYQKLKAADAQGVLSSNQDNSLLIDFGTDGLWRWSRADGFAQVTDVDPKAMVGTADGGLVDFGAAGLWSFTTTGWKKLDDQSPEAIVSSGGTYYVDYGSRGLWTVAATQLWALSATDCVPVVSTSLQQINEADPTSMTPAFFGLMVGFGDFGLWAYDGSAGGWSQLNTVTPQSITTGAGGFYLDYGDAGLWRYALGGAWSKLNDVAPAAIASTRAWGSSLPQSDYTLDVLDMDYGDAGLWRWTSSTGGWRRLSTNRATALGVARNDTGVSYGIIPA